MRDLYFKLLFICLLPQVVLAADIVGGVAGTLIVKNSIIYNDLKFKQIDPNVIISNSAVRGTTPATGAENVENVLLKDIDFKDLLAFTSDTISYYLSSTSTLRNAGTNVSLPSKDINGNDRTYDGTVDIGAVEYSMITKNPGSNWATASDWRIGRVPNVDDIVTIRTATQVAIPNAVCKKILAIESGASLTVNAGSQLTVSETITNTDANRLIIKAKSSTADTTTANGSLIFHNLKENPVSATVEMFSKSNYDLTRPANNRFNWQFFGIPVEDIPANPTFYGAYIRIRLEEGTDTTKHWVSLTNSSIVRPFQGYQICYATPRKVWFSGKLVNRDYNSGPLPKSSGAGVLYAGQHLLANPYAAAIDIKKIVFGSGMEPTVFLYNTGSFSNWNENKVKKEAALPGQYIQIPQNMAGVDVFPSQVPSMSSMLVKVTYPTLDASVKINYKSVVKQNTEQQRVKREGAETSEHLYTRIDLESISSIDKLWIFADEKLSRNFDNGYDGYKQYISSATAQIYAVEQDGNYQINSVDDLNNTAIAFQPGEDTDYQFTFNNHNLGKRYSKLFLFDFAINKLADITANGTVYNFTADAASNPVTRFKLITEERQARVERPSKVGMFTENNSLCVYNNEDTAGNIIIYDIAGRILLQRQIAANSFTFIPLQPQKVYIVKTILPEETKSTKIIVDK